MCTYRFFSSLSQVHPQDLSPSEFQRLSEIEEDYTLLLEATRRLKEVSSSTYFRKELMSERDISEADLAATGDVVME